jgi:predicted outer membrane repeat protein
MFQKSPINKCAIGLRSLCGAALLLCLVFGQVCPAAVTEFERRADDWLLAAPGNEGYAFDEDFPGVQPGGGCLVPVPQTDPVVIALTGGTITVSGEDGGVPYCPIHDSSSIATLSDALTSNTAILAMAFDPPVDAFYAIYWSLEAGKQMTMHLYADGQLVESLASAASPHSTNATGHGFVSPVLIDRVEFTTNEVGPALVGAGPGLVGGEPSLGTVEIPGYPGPSGSTVQLDLACAFITDPNRVHNITQDTWHYSLNDAIDVANDFDELVAGSGVYREAIDFGGKSVTLRSSDPADPNIVAATIIDGTGYDTHVVSCISGEDPNTVLAGFTITGGNASQGGGMFNSGSSPTVTHCVFDGNTATNGGGGMFNSNSSPVVTGSTFTANVTGGSGGGGGMYNTASSSPIVTDCTFSDHTAIWAAGMYNRETSNPAVTGCTFRNNTATSGSGGGAIFDNNSVPIFSGCNFIDNTATTGAGGALHHAGGTLTLTDCTFTNNESTVNSGGGLYAPINAVNCSTSQFKNNTATRGGGLYCTSTSTVTDCNFVDNTATSAGGGLEHTGGSTLTIMNCEFSNNESINSTGGGIYAPSGPVNCSTSQFIGNTATRGGGLYCTGISTVTDCNFVDNTATTSTGGGLEHASGSALTITNCEFTGNESTNNFGGGIYAPSSAINCSQSRFANNTATRGGGLYSSGGISTLSECDFVSNTATNWGGGLFRSTSNVMTMTACSFIGNSVTNNGGGGMYDFGNNPMTNCLFSGNTAGTEGGGLFIANSGGVQISHCTFNANSATTNGGGIYNASSSPTLVNTIIKNNTPNGVINSGGVTTMTYSLIQGGFIGDGNFDADPLFVDADGDDDTIGTADDDLQLQATSPAIDAGDTTGVAVENNFDLADNPRAVDDPDTPDTGLSILVTLTGDTAITDLGAYEFQPPTLCTPDIEGDINCDGIVDGTDFALMALHWLETL